MSNNNINTNGIESKITKQLGSAVAALSSGGASSAQKVYPGTVRSKVIRRLCEAVNELIDSGGGGGNYQAKTATPTNASQTVVADAGYDALSQVTVEAIPSPYFDTSGVDAAAGDVLSGKKIVDASGNTLAGTLVEKTLGSKSITANGSYQASTDNVDGYSSVNVDVEPNVGSKSITQNGTYQASADGLDGYSRVVVSVPGAAVLVQKTIAAKGVYDPRDDNADGYSLVTVTAGGDYPSIGMEMLTPPTVEQISVSPRAKFRPVVPTEVIS